MKYNTTIKNKNLAGVSIAGHAFKSLRSAEKYCNVHEIDPNAISDDPYECLTCVRRALPEIELIREMLGAYRNEVLEEAHALADQMRGLEGMQDILSSATLHVVRENHLRVGGKLEAITEFGKVLGDRHMDMLFLNSIKNR